jgi:hypothetical protein
MRMPPSRSTLPRRLLPLGLALLTACTTLEWVRPDTDPEQLRQDLALCQQEAWREATWRGWLYRPLAPHVVEDVHGRRFLSWPYSPFSDPFGNRFFEESRLADFCMRAKGYHLVPVEPKAPEK